MSLMEALGYVGDTLAKPGRAVRGVLGGRPEEVLAALPFSDSLGITDPANQVRGRDLLNQLGVTDQADDGWGSWGAGLGVDIATDPLTYFGGALVRGGLSALGRPASAIGAAAGSDAANGIFRLDDPIERLMTPQQLAEREAFRESIGQTSPWAPLADELHPVPDAPGPSGFTPFEGKLELPTPPVEPYGSDLNVFDPAFSAKTRGYHLAYGPDYARAADDFGWGADQVGLGHWSSSIPQEMADDGLKYSALHLNMDKWDEELAMLNALHPESKASLGFPNAVNEFDLDLASEIATRSPNATGWQRIIGTRSEELGGLRELSLRGALPAEFHPRIEKQLDAIAGMAGDFVPRVPSAAAIFDLHQLGRVMPSRVHELTQAGGPLAHLPVNEAALAQMAERAQMDALLESLTAHLSNFENRFDGLTVNTISPNFGTSAHAASNLGETLSPEFWSGIEHGYGIDPAVVTKMLADPRTHAVGYHEMLENAQALLPELQRMAANVSDPGVLAQLGGMTDEATRFMKEGVPSPMLTENLLARGAELGGPLNPDLALSAMGYDSPTALARALGVRPADFDDMAWKLPGVQRRQLFDLLSGVRGPDF
jgi:hypothetical protein